MHGSMNVKIIIINDIQIIDIYIYHISKFFLKNVGKWSANSFHKFHLEKYLIQSVFQTMYFFLLLYAS